MSGLNSKEHYELMLQFEKQFKGERLDREGKDLWPKGYVYQDGNANKLFLAFRQGAAYGKVIGEGEEGPLLRLLADLRFAMGDNGKRMQSELVEYAKELKAKADKFDAKAAPQEAAAVQPLTADQQQCFTECLSVAYEAGYEDHRSGKGHRRNYARVWAPDFVKLMNAAASQLPQAPQPTVDDVVALANRAHSDAEHFLRTGEQRPGFTAAPQPVARVELTDERIEALADDSYEYFHAPATSRDAELMAHFARAIEAAIAKQPAAEAVRMPQDLQKDVETALLAGALWAESTEAHPRILSVLERLRAWFGLTLAQGEKGEA